MSFKEDLSAEMTHKGRLCTVGRWQQTLSEQDHEDFQQGVHYVYEGTLTKVALHRVCRKNGLSGSESLLRAHLAGSCGCNP